MCSNSTRGDVVWWRHDARGGGTDRTTDFMNVTTSTNPAAMVHLDQQPSSLHIYSSSVMNTAPQSSSYTHRPTHTAAAAQRPAAGVGIATTLVCALHILLTLGRVPSAEAMVSMPPANAISSVGWASSIAAVDSLPCGAATVRHRCSSSSGSSSSNNNRRSRRRQRLVCRADKEGAQGVYDAPAEDAFELRRMDAQAGHVINWYV